MSLFQDILSKLQENYSKETAATEAIAATISAVLHTTITAEQITIKDKALRLKVSPTLKMAIMLQKEKLLAKLQEAGIQVTTIQ